MAANNSVRKPTSAATWTELCGQHPEFFDIYGDVGTVYLSIRYHLGEARKREPVPLPDVQQLVKNALEIHQRQAEAAKMDHEEKTAAGKALREWGTLLAASIAAIAGIAQMLWK